jgi:hypothetical protein
MRHLEEVNRADAAPHDRNMAHRAIALSRSNPRSIEFCARPVCVLEHDA